MKNFFKNHKWLTIIGGVLLLIGVASAAQSPTPSTTSYTSTYQQAQTSANDLSNDNYYTNVSGNTVHAPAYSENSSIPSGATAQCGDGTYSFSQHRSGTCSHHGGVAQWLQ